MKRLALLVSLALLTVVGTTATTQAYYLDAPHNESNGIYCYTCHMSPAYALPAGTGTDAARLNMVCLQCHGDSPTSVVYKNRTLDFNAMRGPVKKLHASSSSTSTKFGTWTTLCTQCHDVHFQGQLDWTDDSLYLAKGTLAGDNGAYNVVANSTTVAITAPVANPSGSGWDDTSKWISKGASVVSGNPADGTRGLIFVPNRDFPTETFEIVAASSNSVTVKGKMTTALNGNKYGVIYGQSIKSYVLPNGGSKVSDLRTVKFFKPEVISGTFGGYVDETSTTTPQGLCQVCHKNTTLAWKTDGTLPHHVGEKCGTCHNAAPGFPPAKNHNLFIADPATNGCNACHSTKVNNPDSAHANCDVCHNADRPAINNVAIMTSEGSATVLAILQGKGFNGGTTGVRLTDSTGKGINDAGFAMDCGSCHVTKLAARAAIPPTHGNGHVAGAFAWGTANCSDCHSGADIVVNIHGNGTVGTCDLCHVNADGTGGRKVGDSTNGIDGHANLETSASTCLDCHDDNTPGTIHHVSKNNIAGLGNCATCHNTATTGGVQPGNHAGNHTGRVDTDTCVGCHDAVVGGTNGAPVNGSVTADKQHDQCVSCHNLNGTLKSVGEVNNSRVTAMPAGGGACSACHTTYTFTSHTAHSHSTVTTVALCGSCHNVTNIIVNTHNNNCALCHNTTTGARIGSAGNSPTGGICTACHTTYFDGHSHSHTFGATTECATCHGNSVAGSNAKNAVNSAKAYAVTGQVHGGSGCATCHSTSDGSRINSALGHDLATECISCHHDLNWTQIHTGATGLVHTGGRVGVTAGCDSCHGAPTPVTSDARDAQATPFIGTGEVHDGPDCATCHTGNNDGGLKSSGFTHLNTTVAGTVGGTVTNTCVNCHTAADWVAVHTSATVSHNVTVAANCTNYCHSASNSGRGGIATVSPFVGSGEVHLTSACAGCHNSSTGARKGSAGNSPTGGNCSACHTAYFTGHTHSHGFTADSACSGCHGNPSSGSGRTAKTAPFIGSGEVHETFACATCHDTTPATYGKLLTLAFGKANTATCVSCHGSVWNTLHAAANVNHGTVVDGADGNCNGCHATDTVVGSNARKLGATSPYTAASGDIHYNAGNGCALCHNSDGSKRTTGLTKADQVGSGNCSACHATTSTWTTIHTGTGKSVSHVGRVDGYTGTGPAPENCDSCHTGTAGGASGLMPVSAGDNKVHDSCATCHASTGTLLTKAAANVNGWVLGSMAKGSCLTCHTGTYFDSHTHHTGAANQVVYDSAVDVSQGSNVPANGCAKCHPDNTNDTILNSFDGIRKEHDVWDGAQDATGGCNTCHDYTALGEKLANTEPVNTVVATVIATNATANCTTCHTKKLWSDPLSVHGGHGADFGTDAYCTACHAPGAGTNPVLNNIHDGTTVDGVADCTLCHNGSTGKSTIYSGPTVNGIDGDARMAYNASTNWGGATCLTCHTPGTTIPVGAPTGGGTTNAINATSTGGIHHNNKTNGEVTSATCNTGCHTTTKLAHTSSVTAVTLCTDCHNGATAGGATTSATTVPYIAAGQVHATNGCTTCHLVAAAPGKAGGLVATTAKTLGLSNNGTNTWVNGTDGGGSCTFCHSSVNTTYGFLHHDLAEARGHNCTATCHTTTFGIANHLTSIDNAILSPGIFSGGCVTCHTSANIEGTATGAPVNPDSGLVHDACFTCHAFDASNYGILVTSGGTAKKGIPASFTLPNGGTIGGTNGGGTCIQCHTGMNTKALSTSVHHSDSSGHTNIGECEYCHADPRPSVASGSETNSGNFNETVASGWVTPPKHLPCEDCHVTPKSTGIATGTLWTNPMTILAFNEGTETQKASSTWITDYTRTTANTGGHVIANSSGKINNWGMCFSCHNNTTAIKVDVFHAAPVLFKATNSAPASGWGSYLPGRSNTSTLANFNFLSASFRPTNTQPGITAGNGSAWGTQWAGQAKAFPAVFDGGTASDFTIPDPYTATTAVLVPMYPNRVAETTITPVADNVQVFSAVYSAGSVLVTGTTSAADCETNTLTVTYKQNGTASNGTPCALIGTKPNCSCSVTGATAPTLGTSIVDVVTANTQGINVLGFYVK